MHNLGPYSLNSIITGDARLLAPDIPDNSVDLILTDPVYQNIDDYRWLAETAARVLKNGGNCVTQLAHHYLPEVIEALSVPGLNYVWIMVQHLAGMNARMWDKRIFVTFKPWLWFSKGKRKGGWIRDWRYSKHDKRFHLWGDGGNFIAYQIMPLTAPDEIVFDPFTGGATVPAVCKMLGRNYLAFEIDPSAADLARERLANTQPPLFVLKPTQLHFQGAIS